MIILRNKRFGLTNIMGTISKGISSLKSNPELQLMTKNPKYAVNSAILKGRDTVVGLKNKANMIALNPGSATSSGIKNAIKEPLKTTGTIADFSGATGADFLGEGLEGLARKNKTYNSITTNLSNKFGNSKLSSGISNVVNGAVNSLKLMAYSKKYN